MKKKVVYVGLLLVGCILVAISLFVIKDDNQKVIDGTVIGVGAGFIGLSLANLVMLHWYDKNPIEAKRADVEYHDERSVMIRYKAKATSSEIIQWMIMGIAWIVLLVGLPKWITLMLIGLFVLKYILEFYFMCRYDKRM